MNRTGPVRSQAGKYLKKGNRIEEQVLEISTWPSGGEKGLCEKLKRGGRGRSLPGLKHRIHDSHPAQFLEGGIRGSTWVEYPYQGHGGGGSLTEVPLE